MATSSLLKTILHNTIAEGLYNEITNRTSRYYYFLGKTLTWEDELSPPFPTDSFNYELTARTEAITMKEIKPTDVAFVVNRYDWKTGTVYDMYDDRYCGEVLAINLISGGNSFGSAPNVWIGSAGSTLWVANTVVFEGSFIKTPSNGGFNYYIVTGAGTFGTTAPSHTNGNAVLNGTATLLHVVVSDGGGSGAAATATVLDGTVVDVTLTSSGSGYVTAPSVWIAGGNGVNALAKATVNIAPSGVQKLEDAHYYVVTDEYNVYKCLDNNNNSASTYKPTGTTVDPTSFPDGYLWKFMYNIPIALRTKFLTDEYMPVVTALRNQFYSNGNIQTVRVDNPGSGYTSGTITVQGDGYLESDPLYLTGNVIVNGGAGYSGTPTVNIDPPFTNVTSWLPSTTLFLGQRVNYNYNIYEVSIAGTSGSVGPYHRKGIVANGTAALKYIGTQATATAVLSGGAVTSLTLLNMLRDTQITNPGSGYTTPPAITFSGGGGSDATAVAVLSGGHLSQIIITDPGRNYTTAPTVTVGVQWTSTTAVTIGQQIFYGNYLYTVTVGGTTGSSAPVHASGSATNGTATLTYAGLRATATASIKAGAGYSTLPTVTVTGGSTSATIYFTGVKSEASLIPIFADDNFGILFTPSATYTKGQIVYYNNKVYSVVVAGTVSTTPPTHTSGIVSNGTAYLQYYSTFGQLVDVQINDGGVGYTYASVNVTGDGAGATVSIDLSPGDVNTLQANNELLTVDGRINAIKIDSVGWGYAAATVTIIGDGTGATATAVVENGYIKKINMTNYGSGYRWAKIIIDGNGFGAKARAVISPYGGHAKYAVNDLFARTLMFYTNISGDKNQGFDVNNDYRQLGIIKNPRVYNGTNNLTAISASACWVISGNISTTFFPADSMIYDTANNFRFRIVTNTGTAILAQSLDNFVPVIGTTFVNDGSFTFSASAVTPPTVDKYSGDLLFIDNKAAFTPTADQSVTLRTVIRF